MIPSGELKKNRNSLRGFQTHRCFAVCVQKGGAAAKFVRESWVKKCGVFEPHPEGKALERGRKATRAFDVEGRKFFRCRRSAY